ncbi:hypothetical protein FQA47_007270 [Oryzias melastigma]|uniref:Uncharacterized protein n=1 Tax=Oryzias melastigma TaxID=30732 RepID=A0A834FCC3_ORYME|nr:hypothetical protein FQA47_007270 [Oryzias melastigma]
MLLFLLLVFLPAVPIETEVVGTLADCPGYFVEEKPPEIPNILVGGNILNRTRYKIICQTFGNMTRFLTLYDTDNKIPFFSAYRFTGAEPGRPNEPWKIEPQLEKNYQALDSDYINDLNYSKVAPANPKDETPENNFSSKHNTNNYHEATNDHHSTDNHKDDSSDHVHHH